MADKVANTKPIHPSKIRDQDVVEIFNMHTYKRPKNSNSEASFIERFLKPLGLTRDPFGNLFKIVGDEAPTILWSSHTDTVHSNAGRQNLQYDGQFLRLSTSSGSSCLGADCGAGVWIMMEMIRSNVPGLYVFHFGEESGCIGSGAIAKKAPDFLKGIKAAVAFDRMDNTSIITHQMSLRTCSDAFAKSMAEQLPKGYVPDDSGVYTDTKSYESLVPECTNISVGYQHQHSSREVLDVKHLIALRDKMIVIDASKFVIERDPKVTEYKSWGGYYGSQYDFMNDDMNDDYYPVRHHRGRKSFDGYRLEKNNLKRAFDDPECLGDLFYQEPDLCAEILEELTGLTLETMLAHVKTIRRARAKAAFRSLPSGNASPTKDAIIPDPNKDKGPYAPNSNGHSNAIGNLPKPRIQVKAASSDRPDLPADPTKETQVGG